MKRLLLILTLFLITYTSQNQEPEKDNSIRLGATLSPIIQSSDEVRVGDKLPLVLIQGLTYDQVIWKYGKIEVLTSSDNTVTFDSIGFYIPEVQGHKLHSSYGVLVLEKLE